MDGRFGGLVLGILSILPGVLLATVGIILGILGIIFSVKQKNELPNRIATAGLILSIIGLVISTISSILGFIWSLLLLY